MLLMRKRKPNPAPKTATGKLAVSRWFFLILLLSILAQAGYTPAEAASSPRLSKTKLTLYIGESQTLKVTGYKKKVTWASQKKNIVTVSSKGKVTARQKGSAYITAKAGKRTLRCKVTVPGYPISSVTITPSTVSMKTGDTLSLNAMVSPSNAADPSLQWSTSDASVALVSQNGTVEAVGDGTAVITASSKKHPKKKASCSITVYPPLEISIQQKALTLGQSVQDLKAAFDEPNRIDPTVYSFDFYVYHTSDYSSFFMAGVENGTVTAFYSDSQDFQIGNLTFAMTQNQVNQALGQKTASGQKQASCQEKGYQYTLYFDTLSSGELVGVFVQDNPAASGAANPSGSVLRAEEREILDCVNSTRFRHGQPPLLWSDSAANAARAHSEDMAQNNYFDHYAPNGSSPMERMQQQGIFFMSAGENIITGYGTINNAMDANNGWLNSSGHRSNMLSPSFEFLGVGGAVSAARQIYFTENFYR